MDNWSKLDNMLKEHSYDYIEYRRLILKIIRILLDSR